MNSFLQRQCGDCTACCSAIGVKELRKPYFVDCVKLCASGCSIHGKAPPSCQNYKCLWLTADLAFDQQPNKCGYIIHIVDDKGPWIEVFVLRDDINRDKLSNTVTDLLNLIPRARFTKYDQVMNTAYPIDDKTYPGLPNVGKGTSYYTYDNKLYFLNSPKRVPLPVIPGGS